MVTNNDVFVCKAAEETWFRLDVNRSSAWSQCFISQRQISTYERCLQLR